jgi:hypothetical protein
VLKRWMTQGEEALAASEFTAARDRFCDITIVAPKNGRAFHGLGLAYLGLKDLPKAREALGMAVKLLCPSEDGKGLERPLVMNFALVEIAGNSPMRAARIVGGYMRTASDDVDEEMLNTLGLALSNADLAARQAQLFPQLADLYAELNARLEATRPGLKRWGAAWKSPNEVAKLMVQWRKDEAALSALVATAHANWENMKARYDRLKKDQEIARRFGASSVAGMSGHRTMYERARALYEESMAACYALDEQIVRPPFPWTLVASPMDRLNAPPQAVAKVEPDQVAPPPRKRKGPKPPPAEDPESIAAPAMVQEQRQLLPPPKVPGKHMVVRMSAAVPVAPDLLIACASEVEDASEIQVTNLDAETYKAEVVRSGHGMSLLRISGGKLPYVPLAESFRGGPVRCVTVAPALFQPIADAFVGQVSGNAGSLSLSLSRIPNRLGAALIVSSQLVGAVVRAEGSVSMASLDQVRELVGSDLPRSGGTPGKAEDVICELTAKSEKE